MSYPLPGHSHHTLLEVRPDLQMQAQFKNLRIAHLPRILKVPPPPSAPPLSLTPLFVQMEKLTSKVAAATVESAELRRVKAQKERLESLCRTLQAQIKAGSSAAGAIDAAPPGDGGSSNSGLSPTSLANSHSSSESQSQAGEAPDQQSMRLVLGHLLGNPSTESSGSSSSAGMRWEGTGPQQAGLLVSDFLWPQSQQQQSSQEQQQQEATTGTADNAEVDSSVTAAVCLGEGKTGCVDGVDAASASCLGGQTEACSKVTEDDVCTAVEDSGNGSRQDPSGVPAFVLPDTLD